MIACPLCHHPDSHFYHQDRRRTYQQCPRCDLVFVPPAQLPDRTTEQHEYSLHQNTLDDPGYQRFLDKAASPLLPHLAPASSGLDFGCGPAPLLAQMLTAHGHSMAVYDPLYFDRPEALQRTYDFITCTEAIEHFHFPATEWQRLDELLKPGGWLCIMTKRVLDKQRFAHWHYKNDPTHVCFFSDHTFTFLGQVHGYKVHLVAADVVLMHKQSYNVANTEQPD